MRILVGESKFRQEPNARDVRDIAECLLRSHREMIPVSLQFVVSQLNLQKETALARKVLDCQLALVRGEVEVNYVGLLLGNMSAANCVHKHTPDGDPKRMAMISLGIDDPTTLLGECYNELK
jgi:hypothetical protein